MLEKIIKFLLRLFGVKEDEDKQEPVVIEPIIKSVDKPLKINRISSIGVEFDGYVGDNQDVIIIERKDPIYLSVTNTKPTKFKVELTKSDGIVLNSRGGEFYKTDTNNTIYIPYPNTNGYPIGDYKVDVNLYSYDTKYVLCDTRQIDLCVVQS